MAGILDIGTLRGAIELEDRLTPSTSRITGQLEHAGAALGLFDSRLGRVGLQMATFGRLTSLAGDRLSFLLAPVGLVTAAITKLGTDFEKSMLKVVNLAGISEEAMQRMRRQVLDLAPAVGRGPNELAQGLYAIASVGMRGAEAMQILDRSARASAIGLGETNDVARAVVAAMTAYGKENLSAAQATDMLLAAVREGGAEADQFARTLGRVVGTAAQLDISFEEVLASIATFTRVGVRADEAVTALRGTMAFLMKPSAGAREELERLGTSIQEVRDKVKKDGLADAMIELVRLAGSSEDSLGKIIPNVRALAGVLANTGEQASAYKTIVQEIRNSSGDLDEAFARTQKSASFTFESLLAYLQKLAIESNVFEVVANAARALQPLLDILGKVAMAFGQLPTPIQTVVLGLVGITLLSAPLASFGGRFAEVTGIIVAWLGRWSAALGVHTGATVANTLANNANAAAQARAAAVALAGSTRTSVGSVISAATTTNAATWSVGGVTAAAETSRLKTAIDAVTSAVSGGVRAVGVWRLALLGVSAAVGTVLLGSSGLESLQRIISNLATIIGRFAVDSLSSLVNHFKQAGSAIVSFVGSLSQSIPGVGWLQEKLKAVADELERIAKYQGGGPNETRPLVVNAPTNYIPRRISDVKLGAAGAQNMSAIPLPGLFQNMSMFQESVFESSRMTLGMRDSFKLLQQAANDAEKQAMVPLEASMKRLIFQMSEFQRMSPGEIFEALVKTPEGKNVTEAQIVKFLSSTKEMTKEAIKQADANRLLTDSLKPLTSAEKALIDEWTRKGASAHEVSRAYGMNQIAAEQYIRTLEMLDEEELRNIQGSVDAVANRIAAIDNERRVIEEFQIAKEQLYMTEHQRRLAQIEQQKQETIDSLREQGLYTKQIAKEVEEYYRVQVEQASYTANFVADQFREFSLSVQRELDDANQRHLAMIASGAFTSRELEQSLGRIKLLIKENREELERLTDKFEMFGALASGFTAIGNAIGGAVGQIISYIGTMIGGFQRAIELQAKLFAENRKARASEKVGALVGGIADVIGATGSGNTASRILGGGLSGAGAGAAIGMAFGGPAGAVIGAGVGALAGAVTGLIRSLAGLTDYEKRVREEAARLAEAQRIAAWQMEQLRQKSIQTYGSFENLSNAADIVGVRIQTAFASNDPQFFESVLADIENKTRTLIDLMDRYGLSWADLDAKAAQALMTRRADEIIKEVQALSLAGVRPERIAEAMNEPLNAFIANALKAGRGIPPAMQPIIEQLIRIGGLTDNNARLMLGLAENTMPSLESIREAAARYGAKLDELGPKVQQLSLNEVATQLVNDFEIFTLAGVDVGKIIDMMGGDIQDLVSKAMRAGLELPSTMKPLIQAMIDAGQLTDDTGAKLTDMSKLKFTEPLTAAVDRLILKLEELIQKFIDIGKTQVAEVVIPYSYRERPGGRPGPGGGEIPEPGGGGGGGVPAIPAARGGDWLVNKPTLFLVGEAGVERATFSGAGRVSHVDQEQTIIVQIGEETIIKKTVKGAPSLIRLRTAR
jgi:TP901 family phage tail tape measure protein